MRLARRHRRTMKHFLVSIMGVVCVTGTITGCSTQAQGPEITPNTPDGKAIAGTIQNYLNAFNVDNLSKAYSMFADINKHTSLKQFEAQGDPQKGWNPILTVVHIAEEQNEAVVYTVSKISPSKGSGSHNFMFVYPMIKQSGVWKLVSDERDFGQQKYLIFQKLGKKIETYAKGHPVSLN